MTFPTPPPAPPQGAPRVKKSPEHWTAVAALITAVTGVVTFLVGFIGLPAAGVNSPTAGTATVTTTVTATPTVTGGSSISTPTADASPPTSGSPSEYWSGPLLVTSGFGFDLDLVPPEQTTGTMAADFSLNVTEDGKAAFTYYTMAVVPEGQSPGPEQCALLAKTQGLGDSTVPVGRSSCLITGEGRPALVTVTALTSGTVSLNARVWNTPG
ncbi:hypothetical protein [Streptomyces bobili]|uniref:Uncharacterized protein n=1 Tax=Streptomyces bobili TaxID=67280 RepID=A0ABZ1QPP1_9ACTN|nr:hypothetical protein [Streptomyces bobili]